MRSILRQIVAVLALVGITTSMVPATFAVTYTAQAAADKLAASGFIVDQSANTAAYRLADNLLRQEAVGTAANVLGILTTPLSSYVCKGQFSDVKASSGWVCRAAELAAAAGLTNAANATFRPTANLTRFEALVFALRSAGLVSSEGLSQAALIQLGVDNGLITSAAGFNASAAATRGEFFQYVVRALDAAETPELCDILGICPNPGTPNTSGSVSVSLSSGQPSGLIVAGQATADLAKFTFTGNGTLNTVVLQRSGISDQNTLSNVYLYDGNVRLTDGYSFNSNGSITINNLGVAVNGSKTLTVKADVSSSAPSGQTIVVSLTGYTVSGSAAAGVVLTGNTLTTGSGSTLATASLGTQSVSSTSVNAGVSSYVFWSAPLQVNTRTVHLKAANFRMVGSAPSDALSNIRLFINGVDAGINANIVTTNGSNYASFDFGAMPKALTTGSHTVEVRANVEKGSNRTVQLSIQQASDLMILDPQVGVNIAVGGTIPSSAGTITINTGSITIEQDATFTAMTNVTGGGSNTTIAKFKLHAYGEDVKVQSLQVTPTIANPTTTYVSGTTTLGAQSITVASTSGFYAGDVITVAGATPGTATVTSVTSSTVLAVNFTVAAVTPAGTITNTTTRTLDDVTLYYNGSQIGTQQDATSGSPLTFQLGSQLIVAAGQDGILEVRSNVRSSAGTNYTGGTIVASLVVGSSNAQGQSSLNTLSTPARNGNTLTIQTGNLSVSKNSAYANTSANPNSAEVKIGSFVLQNQSTSESVRVTNLSVALAVATTTLTNFSSLKTSETSGSGANPVQPQATNTFSVDFTLAPGATKTIDIFATAGSDTSGTIIPTLTVTSIGSTSNVSATSSATTGQTITLGNATVGTPTFVSSSSTNAQYVATGTTNAALVDGSKNVFKLTATGGTATVSELKFTVTSGTVSSVRVGNVSAPVVSGVAYLTGLNLVVPEGGSGLNIEAYPTYPKVGTNGQTSSTTSAFSLTHVKYTSGGTTATLTPSVSANTMTLVAAKPTITVAKPAGSVVSVGSIKALEVTVTADQGDITLNALPIQIGVGGASTTVSTTANAIEVTKADNSPVTTTETGITTTTGGTSTITFTGGYLIEKGQSMTFLVYVPVTAITAGVSGSTSLSTSLGASSSFNWTDSAGSGSAVTGALIYGYPNTFISTLNN